MSYRRQEEPEAQAKHFGSREERDDYLESGYRFDRKGYLSIPCYVAGERDALVREFMVDFLPEQTLSRDIPGALVAFEAQKFGACLEPAAHGMLAWAVNVVVERGLPDERRAKVPPRNSGEAPSDYMRRIALANHWMSPDDPEPGRRMPSAHGQSDRQRDERLAELRVTTG